MSPAKHTSSPRVLHIRRSDEAESYVLLHVSRTDSTAIELNITATEGENPYTTTVRQSHLKNLKAKNYQGTDDEWKDIVLYAFGLLDESARSRKPEFLTGVEISASITGSGDDDKELVITVRKRIQAITQRLGAITLSQDDEQAIELFEWSNLAITRADSLEQRLDSLLDRYRAAEDTINQLNKQLEEFITSKNQHEEQLMADFVQVLNEKKLKIRNQQRLLASAKVDTDKLSEMQEATPTGRSKQDNKGRGSKRSAGEINDNESESEDGFEKMDIDKPKPQAANGDDEETDDEGRSTPQPLEDEDNTTSDEEDFAEPAHEPKRGRQSKHETSNKAVTKSPPPRRELPFARKAQREAAPVQPPPTEPDTEVTGGETDDDEL